MEKAVGATAREKGRGCNFMGQETSTEKDSDKKTDIEDDIRLLLDCLHFQRDCASSQRQALTTLATMCAHSSQSRDLFRVTGALSYVFDLLYSTGFTCVQQASLYTLGCAAEKNVINQMKLCDDKLFSFLAELLKPHPPATPTPSTNPNPALIASVAYLCGCLMSGNYQGQNMAREKRLLHRLITVFKSTLPKSDHSPAPCITGDEAAAVYGGCSGAVACSLQVWTSITSALCTANNNPQNEMNQCVCSQLLPAALSLIGGASPLQPDVLRPAVSFITSCIANNGTTQGRLRMIGGLHILVTALKELSPSQEQTNDLRLTSRGQLADLAVHIVQALSAAIFMHATNTETVCESGVVRHLLGILQWEGLDGHAQLSIVMCLSMLTEDRVSTQCELISCGGLHVLLSLLSGASGHSSAVDEELSKAITFVLQCCLPQQQQQQRQEDASNVGDEAVRAGIARVEKLLAQGNDHSHQPPPPPNHHAAGTANAATSDVSEENSKDVHAPSMTSSDQSITSARALRPAAAINAITTTSRPADPSQNDPASLEHLDNQRLPIQTSIANWLMSNADDAKIDATVEREDGRSLVGGACNLATASTKHSRLATKENGGGTVKSKGCTDLNKNATLDSVKGHGNTTIEKQRTDHDLQKREINVQNFENDSLLKERKLRQDLEKELERERTKRKKLEKLVKGASRQREEDKVVTKAKQGEENQTRLEANQDRGCPLVQHESKPCEQQARDKRGEESRTQFEVSQDRGCPLVEHESSKSCEQPELKETMGSNDANQGRGHLLKTHQSHQSAAVRNSNNSTTMCTKIQKLELKINKPLQSSISADDDDKENIDPNLLLANSDTQPRPSEDRSNFKTSISAAAVVNATTPVQNAMKPSNIRHASSICSTDVRQSSRLKRGCGYDKGAGPKTCSYVSVVAKMSQQMQGKGKSRGAIIKGAAMERGSTSCTKQLSCPSASSDKVMMIKGAVMERGRNHQHSCRLRTNNLPTIDEEDAPTRYHNPLPPAAAGNAEISRSSGHMRRQEVNEEDAPIHHHHHHHHQRHIPCTEIADINKTSVRQHFTDSTTLHSNASKELSSTHDHQRILTHYQPPPAPIISGPSSSSCEHQCLACKPRLKCATVNSRNFIQMMRFDRFTCAYHRSVVQRLTTCTTTTSANYNRGSTINVAKRGSVHVRAGEIRMIEDCSSNVAKSENHHSLQSRRRVLPAQPSYSSESIGMSCLHAHDIDRDDMVSMEQNLSCNNCYYEYSVCGGVCEEYENEDFQQKSSSELTHLKRSELPIKRKAISQCGGGGDVSAGQYASINVHSGSNLLEGGCGDVTNVGGGHCFCTVSENATPVKKRRVDGGCKGHGSHETRELIIEENEYSERSSDSNSDTALKQGPLHCSSTNNHPDYRDLPSGVQHVRATLRPIIGESSNSSSADSGLHHPPEPQSSENSFNQSSEASTSGVSHDSGDPSWSPSSTSRNNSSHMTDSSLSYNTAVAITGRHGELDTSKRCADSGTAQDIVKVMMGSNDANQGRGHLLKTHQSHQSTAVRNSNNFITTCTKIKNIERDAQKNSIGSGNAVRKRENESHNVPNIESCIYHTTAVCNNSKQLAKKCVSSRGVVSAKSGPEVAAKERETESQKSIDIRPATLVAPESSKKSNSLSQNPQQSKRSHNVRPHAIYHLVAQPKKGKKPNSVASSTFGALIDVTNRGTGAGGKEGRKRQASSTAVAATSSSTAALDVFDYGQGTPAKPAGSKCRSNATGQLHSGGTSVGARKPRVLWSKTEEENLLRGVERLGPRWSHILAAYQFHHSRDSVSLRDKYRNLQKYAL